MNNFQAFLLLPEDAKQTVLKAVGEGIGLQDALVSVVQVCIMTGDSKLAEALQAESFDKALEIMAA